MDGEIYKLCVQILKIAEQSTFIKMGLVAFACVMIFFLGKNVGEALYYIFNK